MGGATTTRAAQDATSTIPIVMGGDPKFLSGNKVSKMPFRWYD
jgi:hypothetical protein